jgi:hypothetical protein
MESGYRDVLFREPKDGKIKDRHKSGTEAVDLEQPYIGIE